jgi:hypothetical protein
MTLYLISAEFAILDRRIDPEFPFWPLRIGSRLGWPVSEPRSLPSNPERSVDDEGDGSLDGFF